MRFSYFFIVLSIICWSGCGPDNRVSAEYTIKRVILNNSDYNLQIKLYSEQDKIDSIILVSNSVTFSADCKVRGGDRTCFNPNYSSAFGVGLEDSVHIVFNDERMLVYKRDEFISCSEKNILILDSSCGYARSGVEGSNLRTYTYEITNEDYENAEPIEGG